jgi:hypothetical protein
VPTWHHQNVSCFRQFQSAIWEYHQCAISRQRLTIGRNDLQVKQASFW